MKTCSSCNQEKLETEFNIKNKKTGLLQSSCKICTREQSKRYYNKNKQAHINRAIKSKRNKRIKYQQLKEQMSCAICGETDYVCLEFHHLDQTTKEFNIGYVADIISWQRIENEINKCVCLCSNCHKKVHAGHINLPNITK